jgi:hypothetical protein
MPGPVVSRQEAPSRIPRARPLPRPAPPGHTERVSELEKPGGPDMAVSSVGATLAVILAAGTGQLAPAVAAAATPFTIRMVQKAAAEWSRKSNVIADTALQVSGLGDPAEFCEALTGSPEMIALSQKILWAASLTGNDRKLRGLGALLGRAVKRRGDRLDETHLLADALTDLEAPHVVVMDVIAVPAPENRPGWLAEQVQAEVEMEPELVLACLNALTRHGLAATDQNVYGAVPQFYLTNLGRALADLMRRAAGEPGKRAAQP